MAGSIPLTGLSANDPTPNNYIQINFAQGPASLGNTVYSILLMGNMLGTGSATADTVIYGPSTSTPLQSDSDAQTLFGVGSELHRMWQKVADINKNTPVYAIAVTESSGSKASRDFVFATTAAGNGNVRFWVGDKFVDTAITKGDTAIQVATNAVTNINSQVNWGVTADNSSGASATVTVTAKQKGVRGNFIRTYAAITGSGVSTTVTGTSIVPLAGGTGSDSNTTALATILPHRFYYVVSAAEAEDTTQVGAVIAQIDSQAQPVTGIRQRSISGSVGKVASSGSELTVAAGLSALVTDMAAYKSEARGESVYSPHDNWTPSEIAANAAGIYALEEIPTNFRVNFSGYGSDASTAGSWRMKSPKDGSALTRAQIVTCLNAGITPIGVSLDGSTYLVKRITNYFKTGTQLDYRIRDAHKVTVLDRFADDLVNKFSLSFSGKKIGDDPVLGQHTPGPDVVTPNALRTSIARLLHDYEDLDLLENVKATITNMIVIRETSPNTRLSARIPMDIIDILDSTATLMDQIG